MEVLGIVPTILLHIIANLDRHGVRAYLVGGAVRDMFFGREPKDFDIEVYGVQTYEQLVGFLQPFGEAVTVGKSFGVVKLRTEEGEFDFSLPRLECSTGEGHRDFRVEIDGALDFAKAARRRDFTINAIGYDPLRKHFLDPFDGRSDLQNGILRHIDDAAFAEDPLRVYRAVQFAARFDLKIASKTETLCRSMVAKGALDALPKERVYEEVKKILLKAPKPSTAFELMRKWGITARYFPELHALIGVVQDPVWHPEGDVWIHTMMVLDAMARICRMEALCRDPFEKLALMFAALCHDLGKATTTRYERGRIRAIGHEQASMALTRPFMRRLTKEKRLIAAVEPLVEHHLKPSQFFAQGAKASAIRRLATKVDLERLVLLAKADFLGRDTKEAKSGCYEAGEWLLAEAKRLNVNKGAPKPWVGGKELIALGFAPSSDFGKAIKRLYEMQLDGRFASKEKAMAYAKQHYTDLVS